MSRRLPARKRFGQHFLVDETVLEHIADVVRPLPADRLLEIGPGHGALTRYLFGQTAAYVAVELDRDLIAPLKAGFPGLDLVSADILKVDLEQLLDPPGWRLVGNLPYNISSPLLVKLLDHLPRIVDMHFMFQRELGARLGAEPGSKSWGRLSVLTQYHCEVDSLFDVPPEAFSPPPKVYSQIVRLVPRREREAVDPVWFNRVLQLAFSARRKRIANGLKALRLDWQRAAVDPDTRPDALSVDDYVRLANAVIGEVAGQESPTRR
ncbi:MAG TPA: 16S rRNA (adenine(1518)-N(6)/adenine(1519)-N(6))-dimethyltransferase RsmA [Pseudomonadales bacterium]